MTTQLVIYITKTVVPLILSKYISLWRHLSVETKLCYKEHSVAAKWNSQSLRKR